MHFGARDPRNEVGSNQQPGSKFSKSMSRDSSQSRFDRIIGEQRKARIEQKLKNLENLNVFKPSRPQIRRASPEPTPEPNRWYRVPDVKS